jgi:hypothetical protein
MEGEESTEAVVLRQMHGVREGAHEPNDSARGPVTSWYELKWPVLEEEDTLLDA